MSKSKGEVNVGLAVGLAVIGLMAVVIFGLIIGYFTTCNTAVRQEASLAATWTNNQNILGQYTLKVQEVASIPAMYKDDLKEVMAKELSSRYGANGSQASMQWIKEHSVNFDSSLYTKIQQVIEAGRNEFQNAQTRLIDQKRVYVTMLGTVPSSWFLSMGGFPKVDLSKYKPVVAADTEAAFTSGVSAPIKMR